jgi:hypothetical protein
MCKDLLSAVARLMFTARKFLLTNKWFVQRIDCRREIAEDLAGVIAQYSTILGLNELPAQFARHCYLGHRSFS